MNASLLSRPMIRSISLLLLLFLLSCSPDSPSPGSHHVILGLVAATWAVARPMLIDGMLPSFHKMMERGSYGSLGSFTPTESPQIWTTIITGFPPTRHGIQSFTRRVPGTDTMIPLRSSFRQTKALWNILSDHGQSVIFIKWWASWPAEPVKGMIVSSRLQRNLQYGHTYPELRFADIDPFRFTGNPSPQPHSMLVDPKSGERPNLLPELVESPQQQEPSFTDESISELAYYLYCKYRPQWFGVYLKSIDKLEHYHWDAHDYRQRPEDGIARRQGAKIEAEYIKADRLLSRFLEKGTLEDRFFVLSDHGMEPRAAVRQAFTVSQINFDRLLTRLGVQKQEERGSVDWEHTIAYVYQQRLYDAIIDIALNLVDREPDGIVVGEAAGGLIAELESVLGDLKTSSGKSLFTTIESVSGRRWELSCRFNTALSLDETILIQDNAVELHTLLPTVLLPSGVHINAPPGLFLAAGPGIRRQHRCDTLTVFDMMPTWLYFSGLPSARGMSGQPAFDILEPGFSSSAKGEVVSFETPFAIDGESKWEVLPGDEAIKAELRGLGYIE